MRPPVKDADTAHPIPKVWRSTLREIVKAFIQRDFVLASSVPGVAPVRARVADSIAKYLADYGETLIELPEQTWSSSQYLWMGNRWDVIVDLWTAESGRSDLVLFVLVFEVENGFRFEIDSVHVP